jgi:hypothetical protein
MLIANNDIHIHESYKSWIAEIKGQLDIKETGSIGDARRRQTNQKQSAICVGRHYTQTNKNNVNKTWALLRFPL